MRGEVVKSKPNKPSRLCFCWLMRNDAQCKKVGNYKHIRLSVIYQKGCCFGRNNRPRTDITVYFVLRQKINNFWNCPPSWFQIKWLICCSLLSRRFWNASLSVRVQKYQSLPLQRFGSRQANSWQFHRQGLHSYASLAVRGQERCALGVRDMGLFILVRTCHTKLI